jgi:hypothetical protein
MRKSTFLLLVLATVAFVAAAAYAVLSGERTAAPVAQGQRVLPDLAARLDGLAWMRLAQGGKRTDFTAIGGRWVLIEKGNYPANAGKVRRLLLGLADLTLVEPKTRRPELLSRLDLDDPSNGRSTLVRLQGRTGGTVAELIVGKTRRGGLGGGNDGVYVRKPGDDQAWLARGSLDLPADLNGWLDRRIVDLPASRVAAVTLTGGDGAVLKLRREAPGGRFAVADPPDGAQLKGDAALAAPAAVLSGLELDDVLTTAELPVPESGVATALFTTFDGLTVTIWLFAHDGADWITLEAVGSGAAETDAKAIDARVANWTYKIPAGRAKVLRTRLADLVEPPKG